MKNAFIILISIFFLHGVFLRAEKQVIIIFQGYNTQIENLYLEKYNNDSIFALSKNYSVVNIDLCSKNSINVKIDSVGQFDVYVFKKKDAVILDTIVFNVLKLEELKIKLSRVGRMIAYDSLIVDGNPNFKTEEFCIELYDSIPLINPYRVLYNIGSAISESNQDVLYNLKESDFIVFSFVVIRYKNIKFLYKNGVIYKSYIPGWKAKR